MFRMTQPLLHASGLRAFLAHPDRPAGTLSYHEAQGFLFAVTNAPEPIPPSEWMPIIFDEQEPVYATVDEATAIVGALMNLYNEANATVVDDHAALPADCQFLDPTIANLDDNSAPIAQWCRGFIAGHDWLEESWQAYTPGEIGEELGAMLMTLSFFASKDVAEAFRQETENPEQSLEALAETIRRVFPLAMGEYATLGRTIQHVVMDAEHEPAHSIKIGRNEPCPCGSGKKYKKCCGAFA